MGSLLLPPGSWCIQGSVCALHKSVSPVLCKFCWLYGGLMATSSKRAYAIPRSTAPGAPPLQQPTADLTSSEDTQTQCCLSLCAVSGSRCAQGMCEPSEHLWWVWSLILNVISPPYHLAGAFPLPLDIGYRTVAPAPGSHHSSCAATAPVAESKGTAELKNNNFSWR